ncbi:MAG TPA: dihydrofolate reductase [Candidatus Saccharimonadia bacterium]|nr:dihydrofolate reductase [Candidatus Saccharimonadia bacterium]
MLKLIAAIDRKRGIAKRGYMPWNIPEDEQYFTDQTKTLGGNVLTGGTTFRNIYHGPLVDRQNFILTHDPAPIPGVTVVNDLNRFLEGFKDKKLWVAGGSVVFEQIVDLDYDIELYLTLIDADFGCDQFFPEYEERYQLAEQSEQHEQNGFHFSYARFVKKD